MSRTIVSTVGTSLLTNGTEPALLPLLRRTANHRTRDLDPAEKEQLDRLVATRRERLARAGIPEARRASAELNGLLAIPEVLERESFSAEDQHLLIATDTYQGQSAAEIVRDWIRARDGNAEILQVRDLRTDELASFRAALSDLTLRLLEWTQGQRVLLNLTGGFKSVNAFLQSLAMLQGWESVFLFENARELLRIPRLPVRWDAAEAIGPHLPLLRRLDVVGSLPVGEVAGVPESLIFADAHEACLSAWGTALLEQVRARAYRERLQPPAVPELVFSERFEREAGRLGKDDLAKLNRQLDALARWVARDDRPNPASLDVKKLAKPVDGSTHQVDAWSGTGKRLFGRFEDGKFVIDRLGDHL
jgi:putative CRISPR-associated protein (TIGR02619 family)